MQKLITKQKGIALIIFALVLVLAAIAFLVSQLDGSGVKIERDKNSALILAKAKTALIGYAIGAIGVGQRPGDLIIPDAFAATEVPVNYDGSADSGCLDSTKINGLPLINSDKNMRCLGRLPWKDLGLSIGGSSENDSAGAMPWYAVSGNLVDPTCLAVLNSNTLNLINNSIAPLDCTGVTLPYPWLTVRDSSGNVLSNRVAAVIFMPGVVRGAQSRPSAPLGSVNQYLDTLVVPAGCAAPCVPGTYNNAAMNNDFIVASEGMPLAASNNFNDQLVYITIEELMAAVEKRAAQEAASQLRKYYLASSGTAANRFYPYAASLGDIDNVCVDTNKAGLIPILPAYANCTSSSTCITGFPITKVTFSLTSGSTFTSNTGACSRVAGDCKCSGAGNCRRGAIRFTCTAISNAFSCQSTGGGSAGTFSFTYSPKTPDVTVASFACTGGAGTVNCSGGFGTFASPPTTCTLASSPGVATLPAWFTDNHWQDVLYYAISNDCNFATKGCAVGTLTVGSKTNIHALLVSSGQRIAAQTRPSNFITNYLDSAENTNGNSIYDAIGTPRTSTYNDQMFIVAP